jgi:hypothetical protein
VAANRCQRSAADYMSRPEVDRPNARGTGRGSRASSRPRRGAGVRGETVAPIRYHHGPVSFARRSGPSERNPRKAFRERGFGRFRAGGTASAMSEAGKKGGGS